jgi:flagellar assembly protein FliH
MNIKKPWQSHRFAPLTPSAQGHLGRSGPSLQGSAQLPDAMDHGFDSGVERGYREGHIRGMHTGLETGLAQGREEGRRAGAEAARLEALPRIEALAAALDMMFDKLREFEHGWEAAVRSEVLALVPKVAREVVRAELIQNPAQLLTFVDAALATLPRTPKRSVEVSLNPEDLERVLTHDKLAATRWNLGGDAELAVGECRIQAGQRQVDAGCEQRLAACMDQISAKLQAPSAPSQAPGALSLASKAP